MSGGGDGDGGDSDAHTCSSVVAPARMIFCLLKTPLWEFVTRNEWADTKNVIATPRIKYIALSSSFHVKQGTGGWDFTRPVGGET